MTYEPSTVSQQRFELGDFELVSGAIIENCFLSYVMHGTRSQDGPNVIVVTSAIAGNAHRLDFLIGTGKAFDLQTYCIISIDALGNGQSSSSSNSETQPGMHFPRFTIRDVVNSQQRLLTEKFRFQRVLAIAGASMGGMQALEWGTSHSAYMQALIALVPLARTPAWSVAVNETSRKILMADANWNDGQYTQQPRRAWRAWTNLMQTLVSTTPNGLRDKFPRAQDVIDWMRGLEQRTLDAGFDANDWIYQTWAYDDHDIGTALGFGGNTKRAVQSISARSPILGPPLDLYNPIDDQRELADHLPNADYVEIPSNSGHSASNPTMVDDADYLNKVIGDFLQQL